MKATVVNLIRLGVALCLFLAPIAATTQESPPANEESAAEADTGDAVPDAASDAAEDDSDTDSDADADAAPIIPSRTLDDVFVPSEEIKADSEISFPSDI